MPWITNRLPEPAETAQRLRQLLGEPPILRVPGAHNALAAMIAKQTGFNALYLSGAALSASMGLPDLGLITAEELCTHTRQIFRACGLPLIVDADTGFGSPLKIMRVVRELETSGAAAIQIEDQAEPKRCGHLAGKRLCSSNEMEARIDAARRARRSALIVARTDAIAVEGLEAAIGRAKRYIAAGADIVFPEAPTEVEMFRKLVREIDAPLLANMTEFGRTPYLTAEEFQALGIRVVIWPASSLRVAARAMEELYRTLADRGGVGAMLDRMQTRDELYQLLSYQSWQKLAESVESFYESKDPNGSG